MRGRAFKTPADIDRYISQGYGQGEGKDYKPWLRVQDVPSVGRSSKAPGVKVDRVHHFLSDIEYSYFVVLEFSEDVIDIREQFPLLPIAECQSIARELGIKYPTYPGTSTPYVLTTDFLTTTFQTDGKKQLFARTVKPISALDPSPALERTLEKLEIEKYFWSSRGIDWNIVTDKDISHTLFKNLNWFRGAAKLEPHLQREELIEEFLTELEISSAFKGTVANILKRISSAIGIEYNDSQALFKNLLWEKHIKSDIDSQRIFLTKPMPDIYIDRELGAYNMRKAS